MKLYEIDQGIAEIISQAVDYETGEINPDALDRIDELKLEKGQKALDVACYVKGLLAESGAIKEEQFRLSDRRRILDNRAAALRTYIQRHIEEGEKFKDPRATISWRKSSGVEITIETENLPEEFQKVTVEPKKRELLAALKNGTEIEGVSKYENNNMQIK